MPNNSLTILNTTSRYTKSDGSAINGAEFRIDTINNQIISINTSDISFGTQPSTGNGTGLVVGDIIEISVSPNGVNDGIDGIYNITEVTASTITVREPLQSLSELEDGGSHTITIRHIGRIGNKYKADGYYGYTDGVHTVQYHLVGYVGNIVMQATLATEPEEQDWFDVKGTSVQCTKAGQNLADQVTCTDENGNVLKEYDPSKETATLGYTFTGNFVFVRVKLSNFPDYTQPEPGSVSKVLFNY